MGGSSSWPASIRQGFAAPLPARDALTASRAVHVGRIARHGTVDAGTNWLHVPAEGVRRATEPPPVAPDSILPSSDGRIRSCPRLACGTCPGEAARASSAISPAYVLAVRERRPPDARPRWAIHDATQWVTASTSPRYGAAAACRGITPGGALRYRLFGRGAQRPRRRLYRAQPPRARLDARLDWRPLDRPRYDAARLGRGRGRRGALLGSPRGSCALGGIPLDHAGRAQGERRLVWRACRARPDPRLAHVRRPAQRAPGRRRGREREAPRRGGCVGQGSFLFRSLPQWVQMRALASESSRFTSASE